MLKTNLLAEKHKHYFGLISKHPFELVSIFFLYSYFYYILSLLDIFNVFTLSIQFDQFNSFF